MKVETSHHDFSASTVLHLPKYPEIVPDASSHTFYYINAALGGIGLKPLLYCANNPSNVARWQ